MTTSTPSTPVIRQQHETRVLRDACRARHTSLDGDASIVHVATNVGENLGLETELANGLAVYRKVGRVSQVHPMRSEVLHTLARLL